MKNIRQRRTPCSANAAAWAIAVATFCYADVAHAYIDPGSGSAIITAILGAIGAVGYAFRKYYYKLKNLLFGKRNKPTKRT